MLKSCAHPPNSQGPEKEERKEREEGESGSGRDGEVERTGEREQGLSFSADNLVRLFQGFKANPPGVFTTPLTLEQQRLRALTENACFMKRCFHDKHEIQKNSS